MLQLQDAAYAIGGTQLLAPTSASLEPGLVTAILGPNGAGKSTLLSLLSGQRQPTGGAVLLNQRPLGSYRAAELARLRAVMAQDNPVAFDYSVQDIVALGRYPHRLHPDPDEPGIVPAAMAMCDVGHLAERIFNTLSGGEKARVHLARVLAQLWQPLPGNAPRWLLLDEPTAALDLAHQQAVMQTARRWAREQQVGVVAVLHDLNLALRYADRVLLLQGGVNVAAGHPHDVLQPMMVRTVWAVSCEVARARDGTPQLLL